MEILAIIEINQFFESGQQENTFFLFLLTPQSCYGIINLYPVWKTKITS